MKYLEISKFSATVNTTWLADTKVDLCQGAIASFTETHPYCCQYLVKNIYFCDNVSDKPYLKKKKALPLTSQQSRVIMISFMPFL